MAELCLLTAAPGASPGAEGPLPGGTGGNGGAPQPPRTGAEPPPPPASAATACASAAALSPRRRGRGRNGNRGNGRGGRKEGKSRKTRDEAAALSSARQRRGREAGGCGESAGATRARPAAGLGAALSPWRKGSGGGKENAQEKKKKDAIEPHNQPPGARCCRVFSCVSRSPRFLHPRRVANLRLAGCACAAAPGASGGLTELPCRYRYRWGSSGCRGGPTVTVGVSAPLHPVSRPYWGGGKKMGWGRRRPGQPYGNGTYGGWRPPGGVPPVSPCGEGSGWTPFWGPPTWRPWLFRWTPSGPPWGWKRPPCCAAPMSWPSPSSSIN